MFEERIAGIQKNLGPNEGALIASVPNRFYLTGFETSDGFVLVMQGAAYFLTDFRYVEKAKETVTSCEVLLFSRSVQELEELIRKHGVKLLYVETASTCMKDLAAYKEGFPGTEISEEGKLDELLEEMRSIKTPEEVEMIKQAQALTDDTFDYILPRIEKGRTEIDVMLDMEFYMRKLGSEGVSFDFIVVSGKNSSLPHGVPTDKKIEEGDFLTMDFGAVVNGYHSDMTRTVAIGSVDEEQRRIYDIVYQAQKMVIDASRPGVTGIEMDKIARDYIYGNGYEGCFGHGLGHSVGIEIHENPNYNSRCKTVMRPGVIMTVEPGIYLEGKYGVRIEDMILITENGCENLTKSNKNLIVL